MGAKDALQGLEGLEMHVSNKLFVLHGSKDHGWFRVGGTGPGFGWQNTKIVPLSFSQRNGFKKHLMIKDWSFVLFQPLKLKGPK